MIKEIFYITIVSSIPFIFTLQGNFVFDDSEAIIKNKDVTSDSWLDTFSNDFWGTNIKSNLSHKSYRPLTILSFRLNYYLSNKNLIATQFKTINLICHLVCCILLWRTYDSIWKRVKMNEVMSGMLNIPVLAAVIFGVHPIHVEAISGIVGRADLLSALTFLLSFLFYERALRSVSYLNIYLFVGILLAGTSMLFKENGITVLGICCIYDLLISIKKSDSKKSHTGIYFKNIYVDIKCVYRIVCIVTSAMVLLYVRWTIMGRTKPEFKPTDNPTAFADSLLTKIATYNYIYFLNFTLLVWPEWLCYDWSMGCVPLITHMLDFRILLPVLLYLYLLLIIGAIISSRNDKSLKRVVVMAIVLMVVPFLPASNIMYPVGFVIAERILYIPSMGYCFLIAIGINKIANKIKAKVVIVCFYLIILIYSLKSYQRSIDWQNEYTLFTNALTICPLNAKVHYNIAKVADASHNTSWALVEYKEAIRLYPEYYQAMNNLANLLKNENQYNEAEFYLRNAIRYKKRFRWHTVAREPLKGKISLMAQIKGLIMLHC